MTNDLLLLYNIQKMLRHDLHILKNQDVVSHPVGHMTNDTVMCLSKSCFITFTIPKVVFFNYTTKQISHISHAVILT